MVEPTNQRRFGISIRALMVAVALCAVPLALAVLTFRQVEALRQERIHADLATALAEERAAALARSAQAATKLGSADQKKAGSLWAGLSVNHSIFRAGQTKDLRIEFTLVNDGDQVIDPKIAHSRITINGKELAESRLIFRSVQNSNRFKALSPKESHQFSLPLGDQFREPGTYRISWKGAGFHSPEIVLRILPEEAR